MKNVKIPEKDQTVSPVQIPKSTYCTLQQSLSEALSKQILTRPWYIEHIFAANHFENLSSVSEALPDSSA